MTAATPLVERKLTLNSSLFCGPVQPWHHKLKWDLFPCKSQQINCCLYVFYLARNQKPHSTPAIFSKRARFWPRDLWLCFQCMMGYSIRLWHGRPVKGRESGYLPGVSRKWNASCCFPKLLSVFIREHEPTPISRVNPFYSDMSRLIIPAWFRDKNRLPAV